MAIDFDKVKAGSTDDLVSLALCEFSRFVDAIELLAGAVNRMAPTADELAAATAAQSAPTSDPPPCPCPPDLRVKVEATMGQPVSFKCGICGKPAVEQPVEA